MEEAERLCDRIIIIDHGKVIANDTLEAVRRLVPAVNILEIGVENPGRDGWMSGLRDYHGRGCGGVGRRGIAGHRASFAGRFAGGAGVAARSKATVARTWPASAPTWRRCS